MGRIGLPTRINVLWLRLPSQLMRSLWSEGAWAVKAAKKAQLAVLTIVALCLPIHHAVAGTASNPTNLANGKSYFIDSSEQGWFSFAMKTQGPIAVVMHGVDYEFCEYDVYDTNFSRVRGSSGWWMFPETWLGPGQYYLQTACDVQYYVSVFSDDFVEANGPIANPVKGTFANPISLTASQWADIPTATATKNVHAIHMASDGGAVVDLRANPSGSRNNCVVYAGDAYNPLYGDTGIYWKRRLETNYQFGPGEQDSDDMDLTEGINYVVCFPRDAGAGGQVRAYSPLMTGPPSYIVTATAGDHGSISPSGQSQVGKYERLTYSILPDADYEISNVEGTCGGELSGSTYTTEPIEQNCSVHATFAQVPVFPPATPTIVRSDYDDGAIILFVAVSDDGGKDISEFEATCTDGTDTFIGSSSSSPVTVSGLTNEVAYTCSITATNNAGLTSSPSAMTSPIVPEEIIQGLPIWLLYEASK